TVRPQQGSNPIPSNSTSHSSSAAILGTVLLVLPALANSNGFRVPPDSATGLAESHAVIANPAEVGATPYNPAAMAFHGGIQLSTGLIAINSKNTVTNAAGTSTSDVSNPSIIPTGFMEGGIVNDWRWGVAFNAPFGQQTNWPPGSFP